MKAKVGIKRSNTAFAFFITAIVFGLVGTELFQPGLFMDGLIYTTIAHNLSLGEGSLWQPLFTQTVDNPFYEHPPLAFWLESFFFRAFGSGFIVDKLYSLSTFLLACFGIALIWRQIHSTNRDLKSMVWLPILFFTVVPTVFWSYKNNMLETTLSVFTLFATYALLVSIDKELKKKLLILALASVCIVCGFLSKGFPALFPLGFFFLYFLAFPKKYGFVRMTNDTLILMAILGIGSAVFFYLNKEAYLGIEAYINQQVLTSLAGERMDKPRWHILRVMLKEMPLMILALAGWFFFLRKRLKVDQNFNRYGALFLFVGLSATLPIMVSPKQLTFYIVPSLPYFALGISFLILPFVQGLLVRFESKTRAVTIFKWLSIIGCIVVLGIAVSRYDTPVRDRSLISDLEILNRNYDPEKRIAMSSAIQANWSLMGYAKRFYGINLERIIEQQAYALTSKSERGPEGYLALDVEMENFTLYKRLE